MPTYDYRCEHCGQFEMHQSIKEDALAVCPRCGGPVNRLISRNVNLLFKGSGWHITDYRSEAYRSKAQAEAAATTTTAGTGSSSGDN